MVTGWKIPPGEVALIIESRGSCTDHRIQGMSSFWELTFTLVLNSLCVAYEGSSNGRDKATSRSRSYL